MFTIEQIQTMLDLAKQYGACEKELKILKKLKTVEEFLSHKHAPYWSYWYAFQVVQDRCVELEEIIKLSSKWSYWYVIDVIQDRWLEAEDRIKKSPALYRRYFRYLRKEGLI